MVHLHDYFQKQWHWGRIKNDKVHFAVTQT